MLAFYLRCFYFNKKKILSHFRVSLITHSNELDHYGKIEIYAQVSLSHNAQVKHNVQHERDGQGHRTAQVKRTLAFLCHLLDNACAI